MTLNQAEPADYAIFGLLTAANIVVGIYFAFLRRKRNSSPNELFLGSRSLHSVPLALSIMASIISSLGFVGFPAHYYAYGVHTVWMTVLGTATLPCLAQQIVPVLYRLKITSVFQYLRIRYGNKIGMIACGIYILLAQSLGAIALFAASVGVAYVFQVDILWPTLALGLTGTVYTALGGLRGVVWTDTIQGIIILTLPIVMMGMFSYDVAYNSANLRPISSYDLRKYIFNTTFDITSDENVWSGLFGLFTMSFYRTYLDQMVAQRYLAAKTLPDALRITYLGAFFTNLSYILFGLLGAALIYWYRDCDPALVGAIDKPDQIMPYYVMENLSRIPGFTGLFLAAVVGATSSTISSSINSQATICYVDMLSPHINMTDTRAAKVTKAIAFFIGGMMTLYATVVQYLGSAARLMLLAMNALTGPYVGMFLLAIMFPCANSKGAAVATLVTVAFQLWLTIEKVRHGVTPERMPITTDYCSQLFANASLTTKNTTFLRYKQRSELEPFTFHQLSAYWSSLMSAGITIILGLAFSWMTGGHKDFRRHIQLTSKQALRLWVRLKLISNEDVDIATRRSYRQPAAVDLPRDEVSLFQREINREQPQREETVV